MVGAIDAGDTSHGAVWASPDGSSWTRVTAGEGLGNQLRFVVSDGSGFIAIGSSGNDTVLFNAPLDTFS